MKKPLKSLLLAAAALLSAPTISTANSDVESLTKNPANWATALGNYAGTRYSELNQITSKNVKDLQPAWSFSTGVLRGHEGGPLVIGDVIYIHTPFLILFTHLIKKLSQSFGNTPLQWMQT
jgi:glucose dehydrogenase